MDDIRESPAISVIDQLKADGVEVAVYDPHVQEAPHALTDLEECLQGADCLLLLTDHAEYQELDPVAVAERMRGRAFFDTRSTLRETVSIYWK